MERVAIQNDPVAFLQNFFALSIPDMPPQFWWIAILALLVLGIAAAIDMFTGLIPDPVIFFGMVGIVAAKGMIIDWPYSAHQMTWGIVALALVWGVNEIWVRVLKYDALGMGDAKWSMLAVTCFGAMPTVFAWGIGAVLGSVWIIAQRLFRRPHPYVHFAPFLFAGLVIGIWAVRMGGLKSLL